MKSLFFIYLGFLNVSLLMSQSIVFNNMYNYSLDTTTATSGYYNGYNLGYDNAIIHVLEMDDSTFLTSGFSNNRWDYSNDIIHYHFQGFKIDKKGFVTDVKNIDPVYSGLEIPNSFIEDDSFVYIGGYKNDSITDYLDKNLLIKLKKDFSSYTILDLEYGDTINSINGSVFLDSFIFVSNSYYNNGNYDFNLTKLDLQANILDTIIFSSPYSNISFINKNFKDSLLIVIEQVDENYDNSYFIFHKIDPINFFILTSDTLYFVANNLNVARQIYVLDNNDIIICGWYKDVLGSNRTKSALMKIDFDGNIIWTKKYDLDLNSTNDDGFASIKRSSDNNFVLAGYYTNSNSYIKGKLLKIDENTGDIIWERSLQRDTFTYVNSGFSDILYDMIMTKDGGFVVNGRGRKVELIGDASSVKRVDDAWLLKTDSCGFTEGDFPVPNFVVESIDKYTVTLNNTSDNYCTASINYGNGDSSTFYAYSNPRPDQFTYTFEDTGTYTIKLTALAGEEFRTYENTIRIYGDTSVGIQEVFFEDFAVSLYPNPSQNKVNIVFNEDLLKNFTTIKTKVFNVSGKEIFASNFNTNIQKQEIDVSTLSNGVYYISFYSEDNLNLGTKKFVVLK